MPPTSESHPNPDMLRAYAAGRLNTTEAESVESHLEGCSVCGVALESQQEDDFVARLRLARSSSATTAENPPVPALAPELPFAAPPVVPGFEIERELGRGGMGVVYLARQAKLKRAVALKMILHGSLAGPEVVARFRTEAEAVARLQHPGIVQIHEVGERDWLPWFSLEHCPGGSLDRLLASGPMLARAAGLLVGNLARAVAAAHQAGVIHRDLKPANVLFAADGSPKISDFGLAKLTDSDSATRSSCVMGSPSYMAPEQADGRAKEVGPSADVWALGAILYECLTGRPPFRGVAPLDTLDQVRRHEPVSPRELNPRIPRDLETVCLKCLEKEPARRYDSATALGDDLDRFSRGVSVHARPVGVCSRAVKWTRKNPLVAGLLAAVVVVCGTGTTVTLHYAAMADDRANDSERNAVRASEREADAKREAERATAHEIDARRSGELLRQERDEKEKQFRRAEGLRLTAHSTATLSRDPALALLLAVEGARRTPGLAANDALSAALEACHEKRTLATVRDCIPKAVAFTPDGARTYATTARRGIAFWDPVTGKELLRLPGAAADDTHALLSPDGRYAVVWQAVIYEAGKRVFTNRVARVYDASTGQRLGLLKGHTGRITSVAFSADGKRFATGSQDCTARLWELPGGNEVRRIECAGPIGTVRFSTDGKRLLTVAARQHESGGDAGLSREDVEIDPPDLTTTEFWGTSGGSATQNEDPALARVWEVADGRLVATAWKRPPGFFGDWLDRRLLLTYRLPLVNWGEFADDDRVVIVRDPDTPTAVWNPSADAVLLPRNEKAGRALAVSPNGRLVLAAKGAIARLQNTASGVEVAVLRGHAGPILFASFSRDGRFVVTASDDQTAKVWALPGGELVADLRGHGAPLTSATFDADGSRVVTASVDNTVRVWRVAPPREHAIPLIGHTDMVTRIAYSSDGTRVMTASTDSTVRIWDAATGRGIAVLRGDTGGVEPWQQVRRRGPVLAAAFSPDGSRVLVLTRQELNRIVDAQEKELARHPFHPARIFDAATGKELLALPAADANYTTAAFSPDGSMVALGESNTYHFQDQHADGRPSWGGGRNVPTSVVRIVESRNGKLITTLPHHPGGVGGLAFSPDGRRLATLCKAETFGGVLRVWDIASGQVLVTSATTHDAGLLAFNPNGTRLFADSSLYDAMTGQWIVDVKNTLANHDHGGWSSGVSPQPGTAFAADGRLLTVSRDGSTQIRDGTTGGELVTLRGHQGAACCAAFGPPDGIRIVTASADRTARIWDAATGKELYRLIGHADSVLHASFAPDGRTVATASRDGTARLWRLDLLSIAEAARPRDFTPEERERYELRGE